MKVSGHLHLLDIKSSLADFKTLDDHVARQKRAANIHLVL